MVKEAKVDSSFEAAYTCLSTVFGGFLHQVESIWSVFGRNWTMFQGDMVIFKKKFIYDMMILNQISELEN